MSDGNDPYGSYTGPPVHGQQQPQPGQPPQQGYPQGPPPQQPPAQGYQAQPTPGFPQTPELDEATRAAMDEEQREMDSRRGGDVDWYNTKKPSRVGETTESVIRIQPAWPGKQTGGFWYKTWTHFVWLPSSDRPGHKSRVPVTCAREMTPQGYDPAPCPVCIRRDQAEQVGDKKLMDALKPRPRYFLNVLDMEDLNRHMKATGPQAAVATFGPGLFGKLMKIFHQKGDISSVQYGRAIKIFTTKVGSEDRDIRYDAIDASDPCPVPQGFEQCELMDLQKFEPDSDFQDIQARINESYPPPAGATPAQVPPLQGHQPPYQNPYQAQGQPAPQTHQAPPQQAQQPPPQQPPQTQGPPPGAPPQPVWDAATNQWVMPPPPAPPQQPPQPPQPVWDAATGQWVIPGQAAQQPPQQAQQPPPQQPPQQPPPQQAPAQAPTVGGQPVNPDDPPF